MRLDFPNLFGARDLTDGDDRNSRPVMPAGARSLNVSMRD